MYILEKKSHDLIAFKKIDEHTKHKQKSGEKQKKERHLLVWSMYFFFYIELMELFKYLKVKNALK